MKSLIKENKSTDVTYCFGYCSDCRQVHGLPSERAVVHCKSLMEQLRKHSRIDFEIPLEDSDPLLSTDVLYTEVRGKMIGILVCEDQSGNEVILKAFSSTHNGVWNVQGWVPALVDENKFTSTMQAGNTGIHPLTDLIKTLEKDSSEWKQKVAERKKVSQGVLAELYALYEVNNFNHEKRSLAASFNSDKGIPTGTGDCCAPKLLNYAALNNLKPLSIAEFFWGKETLSGQRKEAEFYSSCKDKCQPLLGFMLCRKPK